MMEVVSRVARIDMMKKRQRSFPPAIMHPPTACDPTDIVSARTACFYIDPLSGAILSAIIGTSLSWYAMPSPPLSNYSNCNVCRWQCCADHYNSPQVSRSAKPSKVRFFSLTGRLYALGAFGGQCGLRQCVRKCLPHCLGEIAGVSDHCIHEPADKLYFSLLLLPR